MYLVAVKIIEFQFNEQLPLFESSPNVIILIPAKLIEKTLFQIKIFHFFIVFLFI